MCSIKHHTSSQDCCPAAARLSAHLCQRGLSRSVKSSTCRSSEARPAGPMPPCTTTMLPTAAAACAARGEGGSPSGTTFSHLPLRTSMMCTSLVAPARRMPAHRQPGEGCVTCRVWVLGQTAAFRRFESHAQPTLCLPAWLQPAAGACTCAGGAWGGRGIALGLALQGRCAACSSKAKRGGIELVSWRRLARFGAVVAAAPGSCTAASASPLLLHSPKRMSLADVRSPSGPAMVVSVCPHLRTSKAGGRSVAVRLPAAAGRWHQELNSPKRVAVRCAGPLQGLTWARDCHRRWGIAAPASSQWACNRGWPAQGWRGLGGTGQRCTH
jgi:hypothetical protein